LKFHRDLKTFELLKALLCKLIQTLYHFLKSFFEKDQLLNIYFSSLLKPMQACLPWNKLQMCNICQKFVSSQTMIGNDLHFLFYKVFSTTSKMVYLLNPSLYFMCASKASLLTYGILFKNYIGF
jgi:hypothetical protein